MKQADEMERQANRRIWKLILVALLLWALTFTAPYWLAGGDKQNAALLGDTFGIVNAIFSALGTCLIVYTLWMQQVEMRYQLKEITDSREAHQSTTIALNKQVDTQLRLFRIQSSLDLLARFRELPLADKMKGADTLTAITARHWRYLGAERNHAEAAGHFRRYGSGAEPAPEPWEPVWTEGAYEVLEFLGRWALMGLSDAVDNDFLSKALDRHRTSMLLLCRAANRAGPNRHTRWWWEAKGQREAVLAYFDEVSRQEPLEPPGVDVAE